MQRSPSPRSKASTPSGASTQANSGRQPAGIGTAQRERRAVERQHRLRIRAPAPPTVSADQPAGCGSHGVTPAAEKPNGGSVPDHGIGTRQPSRPFEVRPERSQVGSCSTSAGRSSTSGSPSSSPW